jgi:tetratricopeptide (TPR) repeat protein
VRRDQAWLLAGSSYALRRLHRLAESKQRIDEAFATLRAIKEYPAERIEPGEQAEIAIRALADYQADTGRSAQAARTYEDLLAKVLASNPQPDTDLRHANSLSRIYRRLAEVDTLAGRAAQAREAGQRRLELWQFWDRKLPNNSFIQRQLAAARVK